MENGCNGECYQNMSAFQSDSGRRNLNASKQKIRVRECIISELCAKVPSAYAHQSREK